MLNNFAELDNIECYLFHFMFGLSEKNDIKIRTTEQIQIPPILHYCWFGGKEMPDLYKRCIESWYKYCPNYEIKEWNESNCDVNETIFTQQAYSVGKYGFVPDYFRLKIIYEWGGIYLDTDVEILKNIDDLRYNNAFCGLEFPGEVALGLGFGAIKEHNVIKKLMERYYTMSFIRNDGTINDVISPIYQSEDMLSYGMKCGNMKQIVEDMTIYPIEVLSPQNINTGIFQKTENSYMWHHYDGSWLSDDRRKHVIKRKQDANRIMKLMNNN